ncbi:hypothetical protein Srufu_080130 (plasmid) [Streptomyces libani subsp. rufus]|nr:hypothetical protein Srufu_080130 [Streptomyces libani subsp. rufus]
MTNDLRQRIADALYDTYGQQDRNRSLSIADAVLSVLDDEAAERWIQQQLDQTGIRSMDFRNGMHMELEPARELLGHWVAAARAMLGDTPNYTETPVTIDNGETLSMDVKVAESPEMYTLTVQRHAPGALTPHQARLKAEAELEQLRTERDQWRQAAHRMAGELGLIPKEQKVADDRLPEQDTAMDKLLADGNQALLEHLDEVIDMEAGLLQILDRGKEQQ